jgi:hypothetical protein
MQLHTWDGRYLGLFFRLADVAEWLAGREGFYCLLNEYERGRIAERTAVSWTADRGFRQFSFTANDKGNHV